jgi:dihydroorotate dehydrogenase
VIAYRVGRSFAWNAVHPPKLPARPRKLSSVAGARLFDRRIESPVGIASGPLPNSRWMLAYARLGYGVLTYRTVRSAARAALPPPNLIHCDLTEVAAVVTRAPRRVDPAAVTWAASFGLPSADPDDWRADVRRARDKLGAHQLLIVSVAGTPAPGDDGTQLAEDYARCARWAAEAGADAVEAHLACPAVAGDQPAMVFERIELAAHVVSEVRRAVGGRPLVARLGATASPRALHDLANRLAPALDGFTLVGGLRRRLLREDGSPGFAGPGRDTVGIAGAQVHDHCRVQVDELLAWRKAGAWDRAILATGGLSTVERIHAALASGADAAMVATAALIDPLIAARARTPA